MLRTKTPSGSSTGLGVLKDLALERNIQHAKGVGVFRWLPDKRLLKEGNKPVRIGSRALALLIALVDRPGELVSKEELGRQGTMGGLFRRAFHHDRGCVVRARHRRDFSVRGFVLLAGADPVHTRGRWAIVRSSCSPASWRGSPISGPCQLWSAEGHPRPRSAWAF
jgi:hypothetical protein